MFDISGILKGSGNIVSDLLRKGVIGVGGVPQLSEQLNPLYDIGAGYGKMALMKLGGNDIGLESMIKNAETQDALSPLLNDIDAVQDPAKRSKLLDLFSTRNSQLRQINGVR